MQLAARFFQVFAPLSRSSSTRIEPHNIKRILWIRLDHIGDVVMSLSSLQLLREGFSDAHIDVVVRPACAPLFDDLTIVNRVLVYDSPRFPQRGRGAGLLRTLQFIRKLRCAHYDVAIESRGDDIARFLCWSSKAAIRIGPDRIFYEEPDAPNFRFLMTHIAPIANKPIHAVQANAQTLQPFFENRVLDSVAPFHFPLSDARRERVQKLLKARGVKRPFAVLHPCSNDAKRNWTTGKWAQIADFLIEEYDFDIVLSGLARDREAHRQIIERVKNAARLHDFAGLLSLADLAAFFSEAALLITVDTGPMHIAAFVGTPIVALFLPHLAPRHAPFGQQDSVVLPPQTNIEYSIADIEVGDVTEAIAQKLETR